MKPCLGIFDSGLGGFTVLSQVLARYGPVSCVYLADTARVPYGEKKSSEIRKIAKEVVQWLSDQNISAVLIACNTTNSLALDVVENVSRVPVFGLIEAAGRMVKENRVGVLATPATTASNAYRKMILSFRPGTQVFEQPCPEFVPLIEGGKLCRDELRICALKYLKPLLEAEVESIIYGCSHYPLLETILREILPEDVRLVDPAIGMASQLDGILGIPKCSVMTRDLLSNTRICVTSDPSGFASRAKALMGECPDIEVVSLTSQACFF